MKGSFTSCVGGDRGLMTWREEIERVTKLYDKVLMLGDSMGGTGALLFADLASSIQVFTPQVQILLLSNGIQCYFLPFKANRCRKQACATLLSKFWRVINVSVRCIACSILGQWQMQHR